MGRSAATRATEAADALLAWLQDQSLPSIPQEDADGADRGTTSIGDWLAVEEAGRPERETSRAPAAWSDADVEAKSVLPGGHADERADPAPDAPVRGGREPASCHDAEHGAPPLRPAHTDWLHHRLAVSGPAEDVAALQAAAAGAGTIPWQLDLDRLEEDWFHLLMSPPAPQRRSLSLQGARLLAEQLHEAVARRHALATARVGASRACPFDLHALVPLPEDVLRLGSDHPDALAWLWEHWGTTQALRQVTEQAAPVLRNPVPRDAALHLTFWSADWTPWRALATLAARWPALCFDAWPSYEAP